MGLGISHNCFHGSYTTFHDFRNHICYLAGLENLNHYLGFGGDKLFPENNPLTILLNHSDCDGIIECKDCMPLAKALAELHMDRNDHFYNEMQNLIDGLNLAYTLQEDVKFS